MLHALLLTVALAAPASAPAAAPAPAAETAPAPAALGANNLWLVAPLYPGQELLVSRTESAIHGLLPAGSSDRVGSAALESLLESKKGDLACALGERACRNPTDDYLRSLGLVKLVLIKGGQEEPNYRYEVTSIDLTTGETRSASGQGPVLEKALLAALVKVAPLASALIVTSKPSGAVVYVDGEKLGKTPFEGQILPGDRTLKVSAPGFKDLTQSITVPARGEVKRTVELELLPSSLTVKPIQKQAMVYVDGTLLGQGDVNQPVAPGTHLVEVKLQGYQAFSQSVDVSASKGATLVPDLQPTAENGILGAGTYIQIGFQQETLHPVKGTYRVSAFAFDKVTGKDNPPVGALGLNGDDRTLRGINIDFGLQRNHFGFMLVGLSYLAANSGTIKVFPGGDTDHFNDPDVRSVDGELSDMIDLHFVQPQVNYVLWHFMIMGQAGLGVRALRISTPHFTDLENVGHPNGYMDISPYGSLQANLRFYVFQGLFLQGSYRFVYALSFSAPQGITPTAFTNGFDLGLGYAF